ncbi:putative NAD(P)H quinone oxidoreductase, PIG3 family [Serratia rubidaea]|uniref:Putative NAD(P)H quinone oxidoreductase, PIG3 family n=1 Tax=Serratia rubidaea TaxID=61652 RepID=A0A4U9HK80_SERRU|nr:putative NAD(P)H quinone oxidoreductase, PIG3 family [Serratia rubidaea]
MTATRLPEQMRVIEIAAAGGPEMLQPAMRPLPEPAAGEILVRVAAAGVNRPDVLQRRGHYAPPPGASDIPGLEIAGRWSPSAKASSTIASATASAP